MTDLDELPFDTAPDIVPDIIAELPGEQTDAFRHKALKFAEKATLSGDINRSPNGIAVGAVYFAGLMANDKCTQHEVADAGDVSPSTVRENYQLIAELEGFDVRGQKEDPEPEGMISRVLRGFGL